MGVAIGLPWLDAMVPAFAAKAPISADAPTRLAFVYVPNGIIMSNWTPASEGSNFEMPAILKPLEDYRDDCLWLSGLTHNNGRALGDGPGDHARAAASYLTGVHPKKTQGADIRNGISVDQIAAQAVGGQTRFASLELGTEHTRLVGNCDSGYSCAYNNSISWRSPTSPMPPEVNPGSIFNRLFGASRDLNQPGPTGAKRRSSILDLVQDEARSLFSRLGPVDRRKLDEYLFAVRDIEKRIESLQGGAAKPAPEMDIPEGIPIDFAEHLRLLFDLQTVAFQTDLTRITTLMVGREGSNRTYREIGVSGAHHGLTHHQGNRAKIEQISRINRYHVQQFAYWMGKLKSIPEGDGNLLDNLMIVYGSGLSDGNEHLHHDLPVMVAGRGSGRLHPGRHIRYPVETPLTNLYMTLLSHMGIRPESIGDSNGQLKLLSEI
jgi:hypothetical protein